ncbi:MAG: hypothetical protein Q9221_001614 [Calogaya cf. arnoldii]
MAYFLPSYFQKRILRYALSRLDFLDAEQLNLDNLDIAWGKRSVVELRDVGIQLKKLASLLNLPPSFVLVKASVRLLRLTVPADLYNSGIVAEVTGVDVHLNAIPDNHEEGKTNTRNSQGTQMRNRKVTDRPRSLRPKIHDPGGTSPSLAHGVGARNESSDSGVLPTTDDLAKSFLQIEPTEEKDQLQAAVAQSHHLDESQVHVVFDEITTVGVGDGLSLPAFLSGFLKGIGDRFRLSLSEIRVDISLQVDLPSESSRTSSASEKLEKVTLRLSVRNIEYASVFSSENKTYNDTNPSSDGTKPANPIQTPQNRQIKLSDVQGAVLSDASMFSSLSRSLAPSSSSESTSACTPSKARGKSDDPIHIAAGEFSDANEMAALYPSKANDLNDRSTRGSPSGSSGEFDSSRESEQPTVSRDAHLERLSEDEQSMLHDSLQSDKTSVRSNYDSTYELPRLTRHDSSEYPENLSRKPTLSPKSIGSDMLTFEQRENMEELLRSSRSTSSPSPNEKVSQIPAHEDLAESRIFSHEEAESMYMSAMTNVPSPKESIDPTMPGAWGSHLEEVTENIVLEKRASQTTGDLSPKHMLRGFGSVDPQHGGRNVDPAIPHEIDIQTPLAEEAHNISHEDSDLESSMQPPNLKAPSAPERLRAAFESPLIVSKTFVLIDWITLNVPLGDAGSKPSSEPDSKANQEHPTVPSSRGSLAVASGHPAGLAGAEVSSGGVQRHGMEHSTRSLSPKVLTDTEGVSSIEIGAVEFRSDMSLARLTALAIRQLQKDISVTSKVQRKEKDMPVGPQSNLKLIVGEIAWKFYDRVVSLPAMESSHPSPELGSKEPFLASELLLRANIQGLDCTSQTAASSSSLKATVAKLVFGYASGDILAFDSSVKMRESTRDILAPIGKDIMLTLSKDDRTSKIELSTLPVSVRLDLRRLDETFAWLGGFSSILDLGNSMVSSVTKSSPMKRDSKEPRRPKRGVHFESSYPRQPTSKESTQGQNPRKVTARIGGLVVVLEGAESSLRLEGTALKIVSRAEGLAMQLDRIHGTGLNLNSTTDQPAIVVQLSNVRMEFVSVPSEVDLARLVALSSPSRDGYENDEDIQLDMLLRQRRQGGVVRLTAERTENNISNVDDLRQFSTLLEELKKLGTVTKYLPEDDRPGILILALIRQCQCDAQAGRSLGSISSEMKTIEIAHVTFPTLFALGISSAVICRNKEEELLGPALTIDDGPTSPMFMARFIGNEMEPTIKLKFHQVRIEYHVPFILAIMGMLGNIKSEELLMDVAGSIATLTHGMSRAAGSPHEKFKPSTKLSPKSAAIRVDVTIRDSIIGLNPQNSPAKGLLVLTKTHFVGLIPKDQEANAILEVQKAALMITNDTENIKPRDNRPEDKPSRPLISQAHELEAMGYVSVSSISAARVLLQVVHDQKRSNKSIDVEIKDDLFVLETCADSTQTLQSILSGLSPPLPPSKESRYRTEVVPIEDMLSSFSGIAFASNGEKAGHDGKGDSSPMNDEYADDTERSQDLERAESLYESECSRQFGRITDSMLDDDSESVLVDRSTVDLGELMTNSSLQTQSQEELEGPPLEFRDNHFGAATSVGGTAHRWNTQHGTYSLGNESAIQESPVRVRVRDVHVIWNLYDGYDWQHTRDTIGKAIVDVETKALERLSKRDKRKALDVEDDEESVIGDFLFNSIYIGVPANRDPRTLSRQVQHNLNDVGSETDSSAPSTMTSSPSRQGFPSSARNKKLRLARSKRHKMTFELKGISADIIVFPPGSGETQSSIDIRVQDLDIFDHVPTSTWKKFATYMYDAGERESGTSMIHLEILNVRPVPDLSASEIILKATILPVRLHVDQDALDFLTRFFEFKDDRASEAASKADAAFLQRVEINSVRLKLDFKPKRVDYAGIRSGHTNEFMNFFILDRADMVLRHVIIYGISGFDRLGKTLNDIWMPDIKSNQLPGILAGLAPVRSLVNVGGGVRDLVVVPMREYQKDGRIVRSIQKGALAFARTTTGELVKLGAKLAIGTQTVLQGAEDFLTHPEGRQIEAAGGWEDAGLDEDEKKHISLYADQPVGVIHGLRGAYASLERDLVTARDAIVAMPGEVMESGTAGGAAKAVLKGAPTIILRPALGVSKAVGQTLMGATNSLDPANRRRIDESAASAQNASVGELVMSSTPSTRENSTFDKKPVLSDEQRKANHTSSETNRRNRIKAWYWDLCQLVPDLKEKAPENCKRERVVLDSSREFARATMVRRNELIDALEAQGRDPCKELGLKRFDILPPIDPKAMPKSDDDTLEEERRDESVIENANDQDADGEGHKPPRKRRRRNKDSTSAVSQD